MEMSSLKGACRWEGESNEGMCERSAMGTHANEVNVVEWVKRNMLWLFGHMKRKKSEEFIKKVYVNQIEDSWRARPVVRWKDRVCMKKLLIEGEGLN